MSVTVRHLNADSSFLLIFSPNKDPKPEDLLSVNGAFSVLIDPWLVGSSVVSAEWFAVTQRVIPSSIQHLSEIEEPDLVLVSQNKPDHCHKQTLLQLRSEGRTIIAAEPRAAKAIKSWNHFDPHRVHALAKYDARQRFGNTLRLRIPALGPDGLPGELNIAFIPAKNYMTGLHNAFGITYQPPTHVKTLASVSTIELPRNLDMDLPFTPTSAPAQSPKPILSPLAARPMSAHNQSFAPHASPRPTTASGNSMQRRSDVSGSNFEGISNARQSQQLRQSQIAAPSQALPDINFDADALIDTDAFANTLPTPPLSPSPSSATALSSRNSNSSDTSPIPQSASTNTSFPFSLPNSPSLSVLQSRYSRPPVVRPPRPMALSILYSPHGIPLADVQPYIQNHLVPLPGALPLTCLFHGFDFATNPWWFGGNIMMGADSGIEIAKALMARNWISAHDEEKDDRGLGVKLLKCDRNDVDAVRSKIARVEGTWQCEVISMDVGSEVRMTSPTERKDLKMKCTGNEAVGLGVEATHLRFHDGGLKVD